MAYVMIVDDDADFAGAAATVVRSVGHEVEVKLDIPSAEAAVRERAPDLMVLDVMFPEDDQAGFKFARKLREDIDAARSVPVLMLTAINQKFPLGFGSGDIDDVWLPVDAFLEKPVDLDALKAKVASMLAKAG